MRVKPIFFNRSMVQAVLSGNKTVTRQLVKIPSYIIEEEDGKYTLLEDDGAFSAEWTIGELICNGYLKKPFLIGDILYVRETFYQDDTCILYKASNYENASGFRDMNGVDKKIKWKPSIHMPKVAARIWLKVTNVCVEQLQDITEEQAINEGFKGVRCDRSRYMCTWNDCCKEDWQKWESNPWVWVIEFEQCEKPIEVISLKDRKSVV